MGPSRLASSWLASSPLVTKQKARFGGLSFLLRWAFEYPDLGNCLRHLQGYGSLMSDDDGAAELVLGIVWGIGVGAAAIILIAAIFFGVFPPLLGR